MKGQWKVLKNPAGGMVLYGVARLRDTVKTMHSGNLELHPCGYLESRKEAEEIAERLNQEGEEE